MRWLYILDVAQPRLGVTKFANVFSVTDYFDAESELHSVGRLDLHFVRQNDCHLLPPHSRRIAAIGPERL